MKKLLSSTLLLIFLLVGAVNVNAQKFKGFSGQTDSYIKELKELVDSDVNLKADAKKDFVQLLTTFEQSWTEINVQQRNDIAKLTQTMYKKNIRTRTGLYEFLKTQVAFKSSNQSQESYNQWLKSMQNCIEKHNIKVFNQIVENTLLLLEEGYLYKSKNVAWYIGDAGGYVFKNDKERGVYADFTSEIDLTYRSQQDSNTIYSTLGQLYLKDNYWEGKGGVVNWGKLGLAQDDVFVELSNYGASLNKAYLFADSVSFTNKEYFSYKLKGSFEDRCSDKKSKETYPKFISYQKAEIIKNLYPDVDYVGGFTQQGGTIAGTGDVLTPAELRFYKNGKIYVRASAIEHPFSRTGIITKDCKVVIYTNNDSIYHPSTKLNFNQSTRQLSFTDYREGISASPWVDSYHCVDIYTEAVYVHLDDMNIEFSAIRGPKREAFAIIESNNYFSEEKWRELQGIESVNPLYKVKQFTDTYKKNEFTVKQFAKFIKLDEVQAKLMLMNLALNGFIVYESYRETAIVKQKLYDYILSKTKKIDYDALRFISATKGEPNIVLNTSDMDLQMNGIKTFTLSDTHDVVIRPKNGAIKMKKNRNFEFDGDIKAGLFTLSGKNYKFSYDNFSIDLPDVDSLNFFVHLFEDTTKFVMIQTPIQDLQCKLLIDAPNNKSSIKKLKNYPILSSLTESYVYYDYENIQNGVYKRDSFYYKVDPFEVRNLYKFRTDSVFFTGVFKSAGIFEDITQPLKVMKDYSLGFKIETPSAGMPTYGGKGQIYKTIDLSCNGLLATGYLDYLASRTHSKMFVLHPDSMFCETEKFNTFSKGAVGASVAFADAYTTIAQEHWYPKSDYMLIEQKTEPFAMYDSAAFHSGSLIVSPKGLTGQGKTKSEELTVASDYTRFGQKSYAADTSLVTISALDGNSIAFTSNNIKSIVDFTEHKGYFTVNDGVTKNELPFLQYACYIDKFEWGMQSKLLALLDTQSPKIGDFASKPLKETVDLPHPGAKFVSQHPNQGGFSFNSPKAFVDLNSNKLFTEDVYVVKCADIAVRPSDGSLTIYPGAQMDTLDDVKILANTQNKIHEIYQARIFIESAKLYSANGYIDYIDEDNKKHQIFLKEINPLSGHTVGKGAIAKDEPLQLSSAFGFFGNVTLNAIDSNYLFDGGVQLSTNCYADGSAWIKFSAKLDPKHIYIPISEAPEDIDGRRVTTSIMFNEANLEARPTFLTYDEEKDNVMLKSKGFLTYIKEQNKYYVASKEKLEDFSNVEAPYLSFNKTNCNSDGEGQINLGFLPTDLLKTNNYGTVSVNSEGEAKLKMALALDFPFDEKIIDLIGLELYEDLNLTQFEIETSGYKKYLYYLLGEEDGEEWYVDLLATGEWKDIPKQMKNKIFFPQVQLEWDPVLRSYIGKGNFKLGTVGKYQVNREIRTRIQLQKGALAPTLKIHIEASPDHWYYIEYNGSALDVLSSNETINEMINEIPRDDREFKTSNGKIYVYRVATPAQKRNFIRTIELGQEEEYVEPDQEEEEE